MKLFNDYKVIYSAIRDGELHVYATKDFPSADDVKLSFVDKDGEELSDEEVKAIKLVYAKNDSLYYSYTGLPTEEDSTLLVYCDGELVFGSNDTPEPTPPEPTPVEEPADWDLVKDEDSWNAAYNRENSGLRAYYEACPTEDLWNEAANRVAGFNDKVYAAEVYEDAECTVKVSDNEFAATWISENAQKISEGANEYYIQMFYSVEDNAVYEMFADALLTESAGKFVKILSFSYPGCIHCWKGAINALGASYPWAVVSFAAPVECTIRFNYKNGEAVHPWGTAVRPFNSYAIASIPTKLNMPELKVNEAGEAELAMVKEDLAVTLVK